MTTIKPPTMLNSFREHPIDKTGLQSPVSRPRTNRNMKDQVQATISRPAASKPTDQVELSVEAKQVVAKPAVMKSEPKPAEPPATTAAAAAAAVAPSATEAAKGKSVNLLV